MEQSETCIARRYALHRRIVQTAITRRFVDLDHPKVSGRVPKDVRERCGREPASLFQSFLHHGTEPSRHTVHDTANGLRHLQIDSPAVRR